MKKRLLAREKGQGLVEYALIIVLVAIVVIIALTALGPIVSNVFNRISGNLMAGGGGGAGGGSSSVITGASANYGGGYVQISVSVSTSTHITISGDANGGMDCDGSCTTTLPTGTDDGSVTVSAAAGGSQTVSW